MNKCILFSLGLARAGEKKMKIMHLKQTVKYNKKAEAKAGGEGQTQESRDRERDGEEKEKWKEKPKHTGCLLLFTPVFQKAVKLTGRRGENTKACVLIFSLRGPPGPLKLA